MHLAPGRSPPPVYQYSFYRQHCLTLPFLPTVPQKSDQSTEGINSSTITRVRHVWTHSDRKQLIKATSNHTSWFCSSPRWLRLVRMMNICSSRCDALYDELDTYLHASMPHVYSWRRTFNWARYGDRWSTSIDRVHISSDIHNHVIHGTFIISNLAILQSPQIILPPPPPAPQPPLSRFV